jgi:DNA-binding Lrp family transcriptional regulator
MDQLDHQILALLEQDGRSTYDAIAAAVSLSAPAVKRRIDKLIEGGAIKGFTVTLDHAQLGSSTEAIIELFFAPGTQLDDVAARLEGYPEVIQVWSVTGESDAIAWVRTRDNSDLERLIRELQYDGVLQRTRTQVVMSRLLPR